LDENKSEQKRKMKRFHTIAVAGLMVSLAILTRPAYAGHGDGQGKKHGHGKHQDGDAYKGKGGKHHNKQYGEYYQPYDYSGPYFNSQRLTIIRGYYTPAEIDNLPPGLRKHLERTGHLPPGLEKKLMVNQPLPPEYLNYMVPAPPDLVSRLGPLPPGSNLYFYNGDAVLVNPKTLAVMDILHGALTLGGY
jgi:hypothetical protein